mgnify:CR=1 FL=1
MQFKKYHKVLGRYDDENKLESIQIFFFKIMFNLNYGGIQQMVIWNIKQHQSWKEIIHAYAQHLNVMQLLTKSSNSKCI